ncbi:hypothetical protein ACFYVL_29325 [Streptomyces sp. NPDC004111]|uniref:hypothetical protein n=1 Tax=Streptomyces sp. NPDC004111 TaxID=3364690 RepID=UPI0036AD97B4
MTGAKKRGLVVLFVAVLLFVVGVLPQVLEKGGGEQRVGSAGAALGIPRAAETPGGSGTSGSSGTVPSGGASGKSAGAASGGAASDPPDGGEREDEPDAAERAEAFAAVRAGDCLALFDTGKGWNTRIPQKVGCAGEAGLSRVSAVRTGWSACPTGDGLSYVVSVTDERKRVLCLTRQYRPGYCVLGEKRTEGGSTSMRLGSMTATDCSGKVPAGAASYNTVLQITGVYGPETGRRPGACARASVDRTFYWSWQVDGDGTLLCTTVYRG